MNGPPSLDGRGSVVADTIRLFAPQLQPELTTPAALARAAQFSRALPPVLQGGFECRLLPAPDQLDVQQCIYPRSPELAALVKHLAAARRTPDAAGNAQMRLANLCAAWQQPNTLYARTIQELWLEFDDDGSQAPAPSIFAGLRYHYLARREAQQVVSSLLHDLRGDPPARQVAAVTRCFDACPDGAAVSHLGVMLGREVDAVRLNVKRLSTAQIAPYLRAIGWPGVASEADTLVQWLAPRADRITLCLDVAGEVLPTLGLECACITPPVESDAWEQLLRALEAHGLCTAQQRAALLRWPGNTTPANCGQPWPAALIAASRLQPRTTFTLFERRLSHVKVSLHPRKPPAAKAYLWFHHQWWTPAAEQRALPTVDAARPYLERVQAYYDTTTDLYLTHLGRTFQGWTVATDEITDAAGSNRFLAARAGIKPGQRVLDAGCGVCGPAVDIAAAMPGVQINGITLSPVQATYAQRLIDEAGLAGQVTVRAGDYHALSFATASYDVVIFLESSGNTEDRAGQMREAWRVLRPGGTLYIKDAFLRSDALAAAERRSLAEFERIFLYRVPTFAAMVDTLAAAGFVAITYHDLTGLVSGERWRQALLEQHAGQWASSPLADAHRAHFETWPIVCGEVSARKAAR